MKSTLYGKLAAALLLLLGFVGSSWVLVAFFSSRALVDEVNLKLNGDVAGKLVEALPLMEKGQANEAALEEAFHMMMVVNPSLELYLLDPDGRILSYSAEPGLVKLERVNLAPVREFMKRSGGMPLLGDDPRDPGGRKPFSAAPVGDASAPEGYLYVVLGGQRYDTALSMLQGSAILRTGVVLLALALLVTLAGGLVIFRLITRRVRELSAAVAAFQRQGFARVPIRLGGPGREGDEIDRLAASFQEMSTKISGMLEDLREGDAARRDLVASVSHDLRTPLASLQGYLETLLLKEGQIPPGERRRYLEAAMSHSQRLGRLIDALFELAKLESPGTRVRTEPFSLPELVQDVVQKFQLKAEGAGVELAAEAGGSLPFVTGDIGLIERVMENLLDNAIRHTPRGGRVAVTLRPADEIIHVSVRDTGCGIPPESLSRIFDRFYRVERRHRDCTEGAGLGLAISRRILDLHGSSIHAASVPGEGATFTFDLPVHSSPS